MARRKPATPSSSSSDSETDSDSVWDSTDPSAHPSSSSDDSVSSSELASDDDGPESEAEWDEEEDDFPCVDLTAAYFDLVGELKQMGLKKAIDPQKFVKLVNDSVPKGNRRRLRTGLTDRGAVYFHVVEV